MLFLALTGNIELVMLTSPVTSKIKGLLFRLLKSGIVKKFIADLHKRVGVI